MPKSRSKPVAEEDDEDVLRRIIDEDDGPIPAPTRTADGWPADVPVLVAEDMTWNYTTQNGRRDLLEWLGAVFNQECTVRDAKPYAAAYKTLCEVVTQRLGRKVAILNLFLEESKAARAPSLAWQAACWNETLARLGYEVPKASTRDPGIPR